MLGDFPGKAKKNQRRSAESVIDDPEKKRDDVVAMTTTKHKARGTWSVNVGGIVRMIEAIHHEGHIHTEGYNATLTPAMERVLVSEHSFYSQHEVLIQNKAFVGPRKVRCK